MLLLGFTPSKKGGAVQEPDFSSLSLPEYDPNAPMYSLPVENSDYLPNVCPVDMTDGRVSSEFGPRIHPITGKPNEHTGIDLAVPYGTEIHATADGVVEFAGPRGGYGKFVIVDHLVGYKTSYAHMSKIRVEVGQSVKRGDVIGEVGSTGSSTGPHLHYEVRIITATDKTRGVEQNPREYLPDGFEKRVVAKPDKDESEESTGDGDN